MDEGNKRGNQCNTRALRRGNSGLRSFTTIIKRLSKIWEWDLELFNFIEISSFLFSYSFYSLESFKPQHSYELDFMKLADEKIKNNLYSVPRYRAFWAPSVRYFYMCHSWNKYVCEEIDYRKQKLTTHLCFRSLEKILQKYLWEKFHNKIEGQTARKLTTNL